MSSLPFDNQVSRRRFMQGVIATPAALAVGAAVRPAAAGAQATAETTLVLRNPQDPQNLDPHFTVEGWSYTMGFAVYETLVRNQVVDGQITGDMEPHLAESWQISDDGLTWTFQLRDDLNFSDGSPLDAEAIHFSFDRLIRMNRGPYTSFFRPLESVEVIDPLTVQLTLSEPYAPFLAVLATYGGSIINPNVMSEEQGGDLAEAYYQRTSKGAAPSSSRNGREVSNWSSRRTRTTGDRRLSSNGSSRGRFRRRARRA